MNDLILYGSSTHRNAGDLAIVLKKPPDTLKRMIPKTIHCCWFGPEPQDALIHKCRNSWEVMMPEYTVKVWNEKSSACDNDYCRAALRRGLWSKVSNYVRLVAIYENGGIYLDTDIEAIKRLDPLLDCHCFAGFQRVEEVPGWVNNAVIGCQAGDPFIKECMEMTIRRFNEQGDFAMSPHITTAVLKKMGLKHYGQQTVGHVSLFPIEYFYPFSWLDTFHQSCITPETYAIHHWKHSWAGT